MINIIFNTHRSFTHSHIIHIKLSMKYLQGNRTYRLNSTKFVSYFTTLKLLWQLNQRLSKQLNCLNYVHTWITYECRCAYMCVPPAKYDEITKIIKFILLQHFAKLIHFQEKTKFDSTKHRLNTLKNTEYFYHNSKSKNHFQVKPKHVES